MADSKLVDLTADASPTGDDLVYVVNDPAGTPADRKVTLTNLAGSAPWSSIYVSATGGGKEGYQDHGNAGATETIDLANGNVHDLTLDQACTLTLTGATDDKGCELTVILRNTQTVTWPASVSWPGGAVPTVNTLTVVTLITVDGGTNWYGFSSSQSPVFVGVRAHASGVTSCANNAWTTIALAGESFDSGAFHDTVTNNSRLTVPAGKGGKYCIVGSGGIEEGGAGSRHFARIYKNGVTRLGFVDLTPNTADGFEPVQQVVTGPIALVAGDYIELQIFQGSGAAKDSLTGDDAVFLTMWKVGD